jgi:hypothetical protein
MNASCGHIASPSVLSAQVEACLRSVLAAQRVQFDWLARHLVQANTAHKVDRRRVRGVPDDFGTNVCGASAAKAGSRASVAESTGAVQDELAGFLVAAGGADNSAGHHGSCGAPLPAEYCVTSAHTMQHEVAGFPTAVGGANDTVCRCQTSTASRARVTRTDAAR